MKLKIIYTGLFAIALSLTSCGSKTEEKKEEATAVASEDIITLSPAQMKQTNLETGELSLQNTSGMLKLSGQIDVPPQNLVSVSIPLGGYLKSTRMLPGTQVRKGQLLAVMEDPQYIQLQQDYLSAKNKLSYATKEYQRQKELNREKASSDKILQQAENDYKNLSIESRALAAKLSLIGINASGLTENNISRTIAIHSPINGYISKVNVNIGKYVTPSDVIFELVNPEDIHLNLTVYEKDLDKLSIGQAAVAYTNAHPERKYDTRIILVSHSLNENRSAEVHCHFENYDKSLVPGMYMNAEIRLNGIRAKVLPDEAIVGFGNKDYVFVQTGERTYRMTGIEKGGSEKGMTSIVSDGLDGKKVVVKGAYALLMKLKNTAE